MNRAIVLYHFIAKYGILRLEDFLDDLNKGLSLDEIAYFHVHKSQICRMKNALFTQVWVLRPEVKALLKAMRDNDLDKFNGVIEKDTHLRLIVREP